MKMEETRPERTSEQQEYLERLRAKVERLEAEEAERKRQWEKARPRVKERMQKPPEENSSDTSDARSYSSGPIEARPELKDRGPNPRDAECKEGGGYIGEEEHEREIRRRRGLEGL